MPATQLIGAMSIQRTTMDSARIAGALTGAGLVAALGIGPAYAVVAGYLISILLTLQAGVRHSRTQRRGDGRGRARLPVARSQGGTRLRLAYAVSAGGDVPCVPAQSDGLPLSYGLLPYVAKEIYGTDQTGLGYMVAAAAFGALLGSIALSRHGGVIRPARMMLMFTTAWFAAHLVFAHTERHVDGNLPSSPAARHGRRVTMAALLLRTSDEQFRGRIMGIRMLAIYGNVPGLLLSGAFDRPYRLSGHRDVVLRIRRVPHAVHCSALARPSLAARGAG